MSNLMLRRNKHSFKVLHTLFEVNIKYVSIKALGQGSYGVVYSAVSKETNKKVAIKKILNTLENPVHALRTLREMIILRNICHENIIELKDVMISSPRPTFKDIYLVYEHMDTDLDQIIRSCQPLFYEHRKYLMFQLLRGLNYLHLANILHRDLKPAILLINVNCDLKICDYGLARTIKSKGSIDFMTQYVVTHWYRAPELLVCGDTYDAAVDVWSVGCIFAKLLGRGPILCGTDSFDQLNLIIDLLGSPSNSDLEFIENDNVLFYIKSLPYSRRVQWDVFNPEADPLALDLLDKMLVFNPNKRITIKEAVQHSYLSELYVPSENPPAQKPLNLDIDQNIEQKSYEIYCGEKCCFIIRDQLNFPVEICTRIDVLEIYY